MTDLASGPGLRCAAVTRGPGEWLLRVSGEVDLSTAPRLAAFLTEELGGAEPGGRVRLDLARVGFFSAAGLRVLVGATELARRRDVALVLGPLSSSAALILALCGVDHAVGSASGPAGR
jgi:anti-sigma B factor antagonist